LASALGWQEYAAVPVSAIFRRCTEAVPLSAHAGLLGLNAGLFERTTMPTASARIGPPSGTGWE
jgi:hypothetical protein